MNPEQTLAHWRAEESEVRERLAERAGYVRAEQLDGRSGIQTLQAIFAGELPSPPMADTLGFVPIRIEHGLAVFSGKAGFPLLQPAGNRSRRLVCRPVGFSDGLRRAFDTARRQGLHHARTQGKPRTFSDRRRATRARRRNSCS